MKKPRFQDVLKELLREDPRYHEQAYHFLREALDFTINLLSKPAEGPERHVSGQELLEGIRKYALQEYGPLAHTVLSHWGIKSTDDFGQIVFNLVQKGILGKTEQDKIEDFKNGYDFNAAFRHPFLPEAAVMEKPSQVSEA